MTKEKLSHPIDEGIQKRKRVLGDNLKTHDRSTDQNTPGDHMVDSHADISTHAHILRSAPAGQRVGLLNGLQQSHGNAYVQRVLIQAKLTVNPPNDQYEQEADRVGEAVAQGAGIQVQRQEEEDPIQASAIQRVPSWPYEEQQKRGVVLSAPDTSMSPSYPASAEPAEQRPAGFDFVPNPPLPRSVGDEAGIFSGGSGMGVMGQAAFKMGNRRRLEGGGPTHTKVSIIDGPGSRPEEDETLQTKLQRQEMPEEEEAVQTKASGVQAPEVSNDVEDRIDAARGGGESLPDSIRESFEPHFGRDFNAVRVHTGSEANALSQSLQARAFTTGSDIFFRAGDYQPHTEEGKRLLGHEMTHVVQQGAAPISRAPAGEGAAGSQSSEGQASPQPQKDEAAIEVEAAGERAASDLTQASIRPLLFWAATCQQLGAESEAQAALSTAAQKAIELLTAQTQAFKIETGTEQMARGILEQLALVQMLGAEDREKVEEEALQKVLEWAQAQMTEAIEVLKALPSESAGAMLAEKAALVQMLGGDPSPALEALEHWAVEQGETAEATSAAGTG